MVLTDDGLAMKTEFLDELGNALAIWPDLWMRGQYLCFRDRRTLVLRQSSGQLKSNMLGCFVYS
jgi:hypothetical protein